jgi:hypothetical protein
MSDKALKIWAEFSRHIMLGSAQWDTITEHTEAKNQSLTSIFKHS